MKKQTYGFIGCGNMGGALCRAFAKNAAGSLAVSDANREKAAALAAEVGAQLSENRALAAEAHFLFLGVKPQYLADMLSGIADVLAARKDDFVLVSMAAGVSVAAVRQMAGGAYPVIRIMPNTPVFAGQGMILYTMEGVPEMDRAAFLSDLSAAGRADELPERLIDAAGALSGCGPAYVYLFAEGLADGAVACGLPRDKAQLYAAQTLRGAAELLLTGQDPAVLKNAVCSPGGTTIAGVRALEEKAFRAAAMDAVIAAYERTAALMKKD